LNFALNNTCSSDLSLNGRVYNLRNPSERASLKLSLDKICTTFTVAQRDAFVRQILKELHVTLPERPTPEYAPLTWEQTLEMSEHGISYGAHTLTHPILSKMPPDAAFHEIEESKRRIEEAIQRDVLAFCYPNGKEVDFNEEIKEMVRQCGYACAFSTIYGMNDSGTDRFGLKRMVMDGRSWIYFLHDVSGFGVLRASLPRISRKIL
jgi:peptidoglycan/xylan/chitin deacetylase (PgdA/CDA1 family)